MDNPNYNVVYDLLCGINIIKTSHQMAALIFKGLCGCLLLIGMCFGWTYQEASVYICIYMCPIICILCSILAIIPFDFRKTLDRIWMALNLSLFLTYIKFTLGFWKHYDCTDPFTKCMNDLKGLADIMNTSYEEVNLYVYCYLFFGIIFFHLFPTIARIIYNKRTKQIVKRHEKEC